MKINVEVDCTPDEARRFLGLPEIAPMQQRMMDVMEKRLVDVVASTDPQKLMEQWLPGGLKGLEQWQGLWAQIAQTAMGFSKPTGSKSGKD